MLVKVVMTSHVFNETSCLTSVVNLTNYILLLPLVIEWKTQNKDIIQELLMQYFKT